MDFNNRSLFRYFVLFYWMRKEKKNVLSDDRSNENQLNFCFCFFSEKKKKRFFFKLCVVVVVFFLFLFMLIRRSFIHIDVFS